MTDLTVPKINVNDPSYLLVEWHVDDDQPVDADEVVATVETAKTCEDLVSPHGGVLWHAMPAGSECEPGAVIGRIVAPGTARERPAPARNPESAAGGPVITEPARRLMERLGIGLERVAALGLPVVRAKDVEQLAGKGRVHRLSRMQRAIAETVVRSHQTIPAAYTVMRVDASSALERARKIGARIRKPVGLAELVIAAVAGLVERYPMFFAAPLGDDAAELPSGAHIGVTIDVGDGIFVPVVRDASARGIEDIASVVDGFRHAAYQKSFREAELAGGNFTVALHQDPDLLLAIPLVHPGQTCCLAVIGTESVSLGLVYDHRFVNGREAALFLREVKESLEAGNE